MNITDKGGEFDFQFSLDEVRFVHQLFNEACNGLHFAEVKDRIGDIDEAKRAMQDLRRTYEDASEAPNDETVVLSLDAGQVQLYRNVIQAVCEEIEEWEFQARTGETRTRATEILAELVELLNK